MPHPFFFFCPSSFVDEARSCCTRETGLDERAAQPVMYNTFDTTPAAGRCLLRQRVQLDCRRREPGPGSATQVQGTMQRAGRSKLS